MNSQDLAKRYEQLSDSELAAINVTDLVPEARIAYEAETEKRRAAPEDVSEHEREDAGTIRPFVCMKCKAEFAEPHSVDRVRRGLVRTLVRVPLCDQGHMLMKVKGANIPGTKAVLVGLAAELAILFTGGVLLRLIVVPLFQEQGLIDPGIQYVDALARLALGLIGLVLSLFFPVILFAYWISYRRSPATSVQFVGKGFRDQLIGTLTMLCIGLIGAVWRIYGTR